MYLDTAKSTRGGKTYTRHLLRNSYREDGKVKHRTIANLGECSEEEIAAIKLALKHKDHLGVLGATENVQLQQGARFGALWVLSQVAERIGISQALGQSRDGKLALLQVFARIITQGSRLSIMRMNESHAISDIMGLQDLNKDELYRNLDWLCEHQESIEKALWETRCAKKKEPPQLFLYDVTSSYLEGDENELAAYGYNRDGKKSKKQIVIGLLTDQEGAPVAVRVFEGNTADTKTVSEQVKILASQFGIEEVTLVGDRGMLKTPQLDALPEGFSFITAITKPMMRTLLVNNVIQQTFFDGDLHEITYDGIRYIVRRNTLRQQEIMLSREKKFASAARLVETLNQYLADHPNGQLEAAEKKALAKLKGLKINAWVSLEIDDDARTISLQKDEDALASDALLDGVYIIKSDVKATSASKEILHSRYKDLAKVEYAFRTCKTAYLEVRPIYLRKDPRTRGHVFVVMLAYLLVKEMDSYWKDLDIPTQEGIEELDAISLTYVTLNGVTCLKIPEPTIRAAALLKGANLTLPVALLKVRRNVLTKKSA